MGARESGARGRMIVAAADMLARRGLNATSIREVTRRADAPFGSTYHYFPDGKEQVVVAAVSHAGDRISEQLAQCLQAGPVEGLRDFLAQWRDVLIRSDFRLGCPVVAAVEEPVDAAHEKILDAAAGVFANWTDHLRQSLEAHGWTPDAAADVAVLAVASLEGAIALCRARREIGPFNQVARQLEVLVRQGTRAAAGR